MLDGYWQLLRSRPCSGHSTGIEKVDENQVEDTERDRALEDERNRVKVEAKVEEIERRLDRMERRLDAGEAPRNTGVRDT